MKTAFVVLTRGDRMPELQKALESIHQLEPRPSELVIVWNGVDAVELDSEIPMRTATTDHNVGIPAGRNIGAQEADCDVLVFLDDDATLVTGSMMVTLAETFADESVAAVGFRLIDADSGATLRRWMPRPRKSLAEGGPATRFPGGACAIRKKHFVEAGMYEGRFFYSHEETDLAWRLLDLGLEVRYDPSIVAHHPATRVARHPESARLSIRNHVWLARRRLPPPVAVLHSAAWLMISAGRARSIGEIHSLWTGFKEGIFGDCGPRRPMTWSTVWRLTRMGHPPIF